MFWMSLIGFFVVMWIIFGFLLKGGFPGFFCSLAVTMASFWPTDHLYSEKYEEKEVTKVYSTSFPTQESRFSFGFFGGSSHSYVSYLVRTKHDDLYKDIILKDIYLTEDDSLSENGEFISIKTCIQYNHQASYFFFWIHKFKNTWKNCNSKSRILSLPVGSVRHVLSI